MMRPYRLINFQEMNELKQHFSQVLQDWNHAYALTPFVCHLATLPKDYEVPQSLNIIADKQSLALIGEHYLALTNQILFGENKPCFNTASQELIRVLLSNLLKREQGTLNETKLPTPDWFYKGSTSLLLTLNNSTSPNTGEKSALNTITIILSPDWVYQSLPPNKLRENSCASLDEALADRVLNLNLELDPLRLPINQLLNIQIGDVIATDHPIKSALRLTQNEQLIAEAELGKSAFHKSIVLKRSS
jgi:flagellar motor switch/type III secretory pathway protein FliN